MEPEPPPQSQPQTPPYRLSFALTPLQQQALIERYAQGKIQKALPPISTLSLVQNNVQEQEAVSPQASALVHNKVQERAAIKLRPTSEESTYSSYSQEMKGMEAKKHDSQDEVVEMEPQILKSSKRSSRDQTIKSLSSGKRDSCDQKGKKVDPNKDYCKRCPHRVVDIEDLAIEEKSMEVIDSEVGLGLDESLDADEGEGIGDMDSYSDGNGELIDDEFEEERRVGDRAIVSLKDILEESRSVIDTTPASMKMTMPVSLKEMLEEGPEDGTFVATTPTSRKTKMLPRINTNMKRNKSKRTNKNKFEAQNMDGSFTTTASTSPAMKMLSRISSIASRKTSTPKIKRPNHTPKASTERKAESMDDSFILVSPTSTTNSLSFLDSPRQSFSFSQTSEILRPLRNSSSTTNSQYNDFDEEKDEEYGIVSRPTSFNNGFATISAMSPLLGQAYGSPELSFGTESSSAGRGGGLADADLSVMDMSFQSTRPNSLEFTSQRANSFELTPTPEFLASFDNERDENGGGALSLAMELEQAEMGEGEDESEEEGEMNMCQLQGCQMSCWSDDSSDDEGVVEASDAEESVVEENDADDVSDVGDLMRRTTLNSALLDEADKLALAAIGESKEDMAKGATIDSNTLDVNDALDLAATVEESKKDVIAAQVVPSMEKRVETEAEMLENDFIEAGKQIIEACMVHPEESHSNRHFATSVSNANEAIPRIFALLEEIAVYGAQAETSSEDSDMSVFGDELEKVKIFGPVPEESVIEAMARMYAQRATERILLLRCQGDKNGAKITIAIATGGYSGFDADARPTDGLYDNQGFNGRYSFPEETALEAARRMYTQSPANKFIRSQEKEEIKINKPFDVKSELKATLEMYRQWPTSDFIREGVKMNAQTTTGIEKSINPFAKGFQKYAGTNIGSQKDRNPFAEMGRDAAEDTGSDNAGNANPLRRFPPNPNCRGCQIGICPGPKRAKDESE